MAELNDSRQPESWHHQSGAASSQYAAADSEERREQQFWMGLLYAALAGYLAVITTIIAYAALTWSQPNRVGIVASMITALALGLTCYGIRHFLVTTRYRVWFFAIWNTVSFLFIILLCALDGGIGSPMSSLLILPMFYLAIGYPLRATLACGVVGLVSTGVLVWLSAETSVKIYSTLMLQLMMLNIAFILAVIGAMTRDRKDRELRALRLQLETRATTDSLTECLNHWAFTAAMSREVERAARYQRPLSLLVIDIDHFKRINDQHGHMMGDEVLRRVGRILRQTARDSDIVGRPGGDELALLAPETTGDDARVFAERLLARMKSERLPVDLTLSIGVCEMMTNTEQAATLFRRADQALYAAKRGGRNRVAVYENDQTSDENWAHASHA